MLRDRPNHACRARRASVVSDTRDRRCLCAHLLAIGSLHPLPSLTRERSKCEARCREIALTTRAARRASVVSDTRDRRCLCAHPLARQPIRQPTSITRLLERGVCKCEARCRRDRPNHACRARRASVVGNTRDRRCLCAHLLARQPASLTLAYSREK